MFRLLLIVVFLIVITMMVDDVDDADDGDEDEDEFEASQRAPYPLTKEYTLNQKGFNIMIKGIIP